MSTAALRSDCPSPRSPLVKLFVPDPEPTSPSNHYFRMLHDHSRHVQQLVKWRQACIDWFSRTSKDRDFLRGGWYRCERAYRRRLLAWCERRLGMSPARNQKRRFLHLNLGKKQTKQYLRAIERPIRRNCCN